MPIYEIRCDSCGKHSEILAIGPRDPLTCPDCGSDRTELLMSTTSSLTGRYAKAFPGPKDTACCGSSPSQTHCAGPGSCCGKMG